MDKIDKILKKWPNCPPCLLGSYSNVDLIRASMCRFYSNTLQTSKQGRFKSIFKSILFHHNWKLTIHFVDFIRTPSFCNLNWVDTITTHTVDLIPAKFNNITHAIFRTYSNMVDTIYYWHPFYQTLCRFIWTLWFYVDVAWLGGVHNLRLQC